MVVAEAVWFLEDEDLKKEGIFGICVWLCKLFGGLEGLVFAVEMVVVVVVSEVKMEVWARCWLFIQGGRRESSQGPTAVCLCI